MKRFIVKTLLFLLPLFILLILVEFGIRSIPNDYSYKNNWLEEHANEVKVLTFGSSHGYYGINPHAFSELTFNAAHVSQNLNYDKFIFSKFIDKADSLRCVVLPVSYFSLNGKVLIGGTEAWRNKKYMLYYECPYRRHSFMNWEIYNGKLLKNCKKVCKYALCDKNDVNVDSLGWCAMDEVEWLDAPNNLENPELGSRQVPFGRELYIDRDDFMIDPPKKYFRLFPGNEVRLMNAYFVTCTSYETDEDGNVTVVHCTYDPASKGGNSPDGRKVKGTIHWVCASNCFKATVRLYENLVDEEKGVYDKDGNVNMNPNSLTVLENCYIEPSVKEAKAFDRFQFVRTGFFVVDSHDSRPGEPVFNRIVPLKSSFKLPK